MLEAFIDWRPIGRSEFLLNKARNITADLKARGYNLTLRQLYYQLVSQDVIPNNQLSYDRLGVLIDNARKAGRFDWNFIDDRTRTLRGVGTQAGPEEVLAGLDYLTLDAWAVQARRVEVWVEKDALVDVIGKAARKMRIDYFSCRGYTSSSAMYRAAKRHAEYEQESGQAPLVLHLGDHDPSGLDMTRDIEERLHLFGAASEVRRIALTMDQIGQYAPPPNPAKLTDSRAKDYIEQYGDQSWELDALDPEVLEALIEEHVEAEIDPEVWAATLDEEADGNEFLRGVSDNVSTLKKLHAVEWDVVDPDDHAEAVADVDRLTTNLDEMMRQRSVALEEVEAEKRRAEVAVREAADLKARAEGAEGALAQIHAMGTGTPETLKASLREAMDDVGDTTRAAALKKKIRALIEEA